MRLVCPNCSAQYEVDAAVIPDEGRDVLCSNCGHAWFQLSERQLAAGSADEQSEAVGIEAAADETGSPAEDLVQPAEALVEPPLTTPPLPTPEPEQTPAGRAAQAAARTAASVQAAAEDAVRAVETSRSHGAAPAQETVAEDFGTSAPAAEVRAAVAADDAHTASIASVPPRRTLDDDMLSVLREEAAREAEARRAEGTSIETQPELGLPEAEEPLPTIESIGAATVRALRHRDEDRAKEEAEIGPPAPVNRKALLPDIEEINSTLTASSERHDLPSHLDELDRRRNRSSFRAGFSVSLLIALGLLLLYVTAPRLSQSLPALAPALDRYVASVDAGRMWLDARLRNSEAAGTN